MRVLWRVLLALAACVLCGCSTLSHYTSRTAKGQKSFSRMDFKDAGREYDSKAGGLDGLCYLFEAGTAYHAGGEYDKSNRRFDDAYRTIREFDGRASISARDTASGAGTLVLNEKAAAYRGEAFERVYVHTYSALNYLLEGDWSRARVEAKRAFQRQQYERMGFQKEYDRAVSSAKQKGVFSQRALSVAKSRYGAAPKMSEAELFQDAFAYYLGSVIYEIGGEYNQGLVEIRNALKFKERSKLIRRQAVRLAEKARTQGVYLTLPSYLKGQKVRLPGKGEGAVVVFFACGQAPMKQEVKITLPVPTGRGVTQNTIAFPKYRGRPNPVAYGVARLGSVSLGRTETLSDVGAKARATLYRRLPTLVMKSLIRAAGRFAAQAAILHSGSDKRGRDRRSREQELREQRAKQFLASMVGAVGRAVEQADLRSWLTLPRSFQAARGLAKAGKGRFTFELKSQSGSRQGSVSSDIEVRSLGITVVVVRSVGNRAVVHWRAFSPPQR